MTKTELLALAETMGIEVDPKAKKAEIEAAIEAAGTEEESRESRIAKAMSATLNRYKSGYTIAKTASGRPTLHNGDELAVAMGALDHTGVARCAEVLLGLAPGSLWSGDGTGKYDHLNNGQVRMNSGNRIRAAVKRGDITTETALDVIAEGGRGEASGRMIEMYEAEKAAA